MPSPGPAAPQWIRNHHAKDNIFSYFTYITAAIFSLMVTLNVGPVFIIDPVVGASSVNVARDVIYSVVIAGALVVFLTEFGLLEFIGTLMEPIMRKCFRVPGKSSIDALSSFVCSPAVGVMITSSSTGTIWSGRGMSVPAATFCCFRNLYTTWQTAYPGPTPCPPRAAAWSASCCPA